MTEYVENKELNKMLNDMIADDNFPEFHPIREAQVRIASVVRVRMNKDGEDIPPKGDPTVLRKLDELDKLFIDCDFIVIIDNYSWNHAPSRLHQEALVHRCLMKIDIEPTEKGVKMKTRKPDIVLFSTTASRFGPVEDKEIALRDVLALGAKEAAKRLGPPKKEKEKEDADK